MQLLKPNNFLIFTVSAITSSLITATPSLAATLAASEAGFRIYNFNISPQEVKTFADTNTQAVSFGSQSQANADAFASSNFTSSMYPPQSAADNLSLTRATGRGKDYFGIAESYASVTGYNFQVASAGTFSFDFMGFLNLQAMVDNPKTEYAGADGVISLQLYDQDSGILIDSLSIEGNITSSNNSDFLTNNKTKNFSFIPAGTSFNTEFDGINKYADASIEGNYSRKFAAGTNLSLFELKSNRARVVVPETTSHIALVFGAASIFLITKVKRKLVNNKITILCAK